MVGESLLRCHSNAAFTSRHLPPAGVLDPSCNQNLSANHVGFNGSVLTVSRGPDFSGKKRLFLRPSLAYEIPAWKRLSEQICCVSKQKSQRSNLSFYS